MNAIRKSFHNLFTPIKPLPVGVYHYISPPNDQRNYRLHLRLEEDGTGVLIINAATILHLNQTAAEMAYYVVQNTPPDQIPDKMVKRYHVDAEQVQHDYQSLVNRIQTLINTPDLDPDTFLDFSRKTPFSGHISAPYRLDCALTYNLPAHEDRVSAPVERVERELTTLEWQTVIDKAWDLGIPHIVFTGGEPTLREDLPDLIARAEANGQVTGLLTEGLRLADIPYMNRLLSTGLDHLMLVIQPENEQFWAALDNALAADLFVAVHLTLTPDNIESIPALLDRLAARGVKAISLSASEKSLADALHAARDQVASLNLELVWNLPVPYSAVHPVALETGQEIPAGAGRAWLYVEPDGDVLPAQGMSQVLGNILRDPWGNIWK